MKINKNNLKFSIILPLTLIVVFVFINIKLKNKEQLLNNQIKVISKIETKKENESKHIYSEDIIISLEKQFKDFSNNNYIKTTKNNNGLNIQVEIIGNKDLIKQNINNVIYKNTEININSINITKIDENNIVCKFDAQIK